MFRLVLILFLFLFPISSNAKDPTAVTIQDAWVREAPPVVKVLAGYLTIHNYSLDVMTITHFESPAFKRIEMHQTVHKGDIASMQRHFCLRLGPGESLNFKPGDYHLMLFNPVQPLRTTDTVTFTMHYNDKTLSFSAMVKKMTGAEHHP